MYQNIFAYKPDLTILQLNPMHYLVRQRFISHKLALEQVPDYNEKANFSLDHPMPLT